MEGSSDSVSTAEPLKQVFVRLRSHSTGELLAPDELRQRLVEDAEAQGTNLTKVVIEILSQHYGVPFDAQGRRAIADPHGAELNLRLPMQLYRAVAVNASFVPRTPQREILAVLCQHYGLTLLKPPRRTRRRAPRAAA